MTEESKSYGTNNPYALREQCYWGGKHNWEFKEQLGRCLSLNVCSKCGATHKIQSD